MGRLWSSAEDMKAALAVVPREKFGCIQHGKVHDPECPFCLRATIMGVRPWRNPKSGEYELPSTGK